MVRYYDSGDEEEEEDTSSDYCGYEEDRGSSGEEQTDYDEETPYQPPSPPPFLSRKRRKKQSHFSYQHTDTDTDEITQPDLLSALPDSILLHILSFLPIKDLVKTGTLSPRWQYLWTSVETISISYRYSLINEQHYQNFVTFLDKALLLLTHSNLKRFSFDFAYERRFVSNVNLWLRFASQKNVQELDLNFYTPLPGNRYLLPQHLFSNHSLVTMSLSKCKIRPHDVPDWSSLRFLTIKNSELAHSSVCKILKGSPALEFLELYRCHLSYEGRELGYSLTLDSRSLKKLVIRGYRSPYYNEDEPDFRISAPSILSLEIRGYLERRQIQLLNVSSLVEAKLDFHIAVPRSNRDDDFKATGNVVMDVLTRLKHVNNLTLGSWCIQVLSILEVKGLPFPLFKCTSLTLLTNMGKWYLPGMASLLQSSLDLDTLVIDFESDYFELHLGSNFVNSHDFVGESYWESQKSESAFKCSLRHLKTVKVFGFTEESCELEVALVKFLLENAPVLDKLVIYQGSVGCEAVAPSFLHHTRRLSSFPRSSPSAVIMFPQVA